MNVIDRLIDAGITPQRKSAKMLSTFAIGGELSCYVEVADKDSLVKVHQILDGEKTLFIGNGGNLLFPDTEYSLPVIKLGRGFNYTVELSDTEFEVGGATSLVALSAKMSEQGLSGLEFAAGIPASVGGAVSMNAGAHGSSISNVITGVECLLSDGTLRYFEKEELEFGYRYSKLPGIVSAVTIKLEAADKAFTAAKRKEFLEIRRAKQPLEYPSAGSIFKNPSTAAGFLLEQVGLKGYVVGGAKYSEKHANWIVNYSRNACASDVLTLINEGQERVQKSFGIELECEIKILG